MVDKINVDETWGSIRNKLNGLAAEMRLDGYRLIATNPATFNSLSGPSTAPTELTWKTRHIATQKASRLKVLFANFAPIQGVSQNGNYNDITVGGSFQKMGTNVSDQTGFIAPISFPNGRLKSTVSPFALLSSDPTFFQVDEGESFYFNTYSANILPDGPASGPTLADVSTGGTLVGGATYNLAYSYVFRDGYESNLSPGTAITLAAGANTRSITVTAPTSIAGAIGYRVWMTGRNAAIGNLYSPTPNIKKFGTDTSVTAEISTNNQRFSRAGGSVYMPYGPGVAGGSIFAGLDTGEGSAVGDQTLHAGTVTQSPGTNGYWPVAFLGKPVGAPKPTFALIGDSLQDGTGDQGFFAGGGGAATRALTNQTALKFNPATLPSYAYVRVPKGGEKASQFAATTSSNQYERTRLTISELGSNVISNYGVNDLGDGLAALKASILVLANWYASRGIKFYQETLPPKTTSTDGWRTVANQTVSATEATRTAFNDWLRDPGVNGFVVQSGYSSMVAVIDIASTVEVNSSNVLTVNGGFWIVPPTAPNITGTLTSVVSAAEFRDSSKTWGRNDYKGYCVVMTSGTASGKVGCLYYNLADGTMNTGSSIGATPNIGDSYVITNVATIDGTHASSWAYIQMAAVITSAFSVSPPIV